MKIFRRALPLMLIFALLCLTGCGEAAPAQTATVAFTDSTGRTVTVPEKPERVAVTAPMAQLAVFALAPETLVGVPVSWNEGAEDYIDARYLALPVLGQLYGGKGALNAEELLSTGAQLVIDLGESKDGIAEDMDALQKQFGVPFVHIDATVDSFAEAFRMLGRLLGREETAETLARYCEHTVAEADALIDRVGEENRVSMLYLLGDSGTNVIAQGSYHAAVIDRLARNAAVVDTPSAKGTGNETDMEQLLLWDSDVIVFAPGSVYERVGTDAVWSRLRAVRTGRYYPAPFAVNNLMGFPPGVQCLGGMWWLGAKLYPDAFTADLKAELTEFYRLVYHCELTEAQCAALIGG